MARRPTPCYATAGKYYMDEIKDSLSLLDVVYEDQFEGEFISQETLERTEENFYRGAPPNWLNFHISHQADGTGTPFIKRDGYQTLVQQIHRRREGPGTSAIKLLHQQGCGGTTLAMQVLWDLRKTFMCAVLTGSTLDIREVAKQVVCLFTAGSRGHQKTVLLLLNDDFIVDRLRDAIMEEIVEQEIEIDIPVVVFLSCVRTSEQVILKKEQSYEMKQKFKRNERKYVILKRTLSDTEKQQFNEKKEELRRRYGDRCKLFHGFNILQTNFSQDYIQDSCEIFKTIKKTNKPQTQLAAFLSLLNAYVPGSYLLESQCLDLLEHDDDIYGYLPLEDLMKPFTHLIVTFQQDVRAEKKVRMVHPLIAQCCTELMADEAGVARSDTAIQFLTCFCKDEVPPCTFGFIKDMLTKREMKKEESMENEEKFEGRPRREDTQEKFSRLILDIKEKEEKKQSATLLKVASNKFVQNSVFPQALARFYYGELKDYNKAEKWAITAKQRDPKKSFIADTLGQVHKHHLKSKGPSTTPREILQLAQKAIKAFEDEEELAEYEHGKGMNEDKKTKELRAFNSSGHFGYLQVCNLLYNHLIKRGEIWKQVLTKNVSMGSVLESLGDNKLSKFNDLINSLRDTVEKKVEFFDTFLTYSQSVMKKDDESYISSETAECYKKYVGDSAPKQKDKLSQTLHKLKQKLAATSAGVLSCLDRRCSILDVKNIAAWWKEICQRKDSSKHDLANYILANIMLENMNEPPTSPDYQSAFKEKTHLASEAQPEFHMLALLVCWPTFDEDRCISDLCGLIKNVQQSYEHEYKRLLQSRYLRPLFFIGTGKGLNRFVHRRVLEIRWLKDALKESNAIWRNESIFKDPTVQEHLLKVQGVVQNYRLHAMFGGTEIEVEANRRDRLWKSGQVSFYLGFTIRGPVAFDIQRRTTTKGKLGACVDVVGSTHWTKLVPEVETKGDIQTYSLQSCRGCYECSVSALRWVCKERVRIEYQFCSWEEHRESPACMDYMPAGPLLKISVKAGKLDMVHLPHWIDCDSTSVDMFAVLHVDTCGDSVESVSEVTASHVKLLHPARSPIGAIIQRKLGLKVYCDALIFKTKQDFLTLRVYLVPPDRDLQQKVEKKEESYGSIRIPKLSPNESLQMWDHFVLKADPVAAVQPDKLKLRHEWTNYFEMFIRNADHSFILKLEKEKRNSLEDTLWTCTIRKGDYQNTCSNDGQETMASDMHLLM
ncbi:sterile alpha motif domain-containing protein 9-like [Mugil cephalus]|uniref:sterile alpha motif domain-containing protein 9-like n=1 Tax=Mugil cephalus TaxID=48193 RepID=UPI001FB5F7CF|nr:sterile alpha motif domain-containing protein 9-like [Mugil cephalus]